MAPETACIHTLRHTATTVEADRHAHLTVRDLEIDLAARIVTAGGEQVQLSAKEYESWPRSPKMVRVLKKEDVLRDLRGLQVTR